jgi:hypothetical protein
MATQNGPPNDVNDQVAYRPYPRESHTHHTVEITPFHAGPMTVRRANPAVSHWNVATRANGFQVCVTNSSSSAHGYAARNSWAEIFRVSVGKGTTPGVLAWCLILPTSQ